MQSVGEDGSVSRVLALNRRVPRLSKGSLLTRCSREAASVKAP
jgi:hypothetical protein